MQGFSTFVSEFKVPLDNRVIAEVYKKCSLNNQPLLFEHFDRAITKLGVKLNQDQIEKAHKKSLLIAQELVDRKAA